MADRFARQERRRSSRSLFAFFVVCSCGRMSVPGGLSSRAPMTPVVRRSVPVVVGGGHPVEREARPLVEHQCPIGEPVGEELAGDLVASVAVGFAGEVDEHRVVGIVCREHRPLLGVDHVVRRGDHLAQVGASQVVADADEGFESSHDPSLAGWPGALRTRPRRRDLARRHAHPRRRRRRAATPGDRGRGRVRDQQLQSAGRRCRGQAGPPGRRRRRAT